MLSYKEIPINVTPAGEFTATVAGAPVTKPSMAAMKKHIDKAGATVFAPIKILHLPYNWSTRIEQRTVTGTRVKPGSKTGEIVWRDDRGNTYERIIEDTPENRAMLEAYIALYVRNQKERDAGRKAEAEAWGAFPFRAPVKS